MESIWAFLSDPDNQRTLNWLGAGLVVVAGGLWTMIQFVWSPSYAAGGPKPTAAAPTRPVSPTPKSGFSAIQVGLLVAVVAGALILAAAFAGTRITATNSFVNPGTIENSTITIQGGSGRIER